MKEAALKMAMTMDSMDQTEKEILHPTREWLEANMLTVGKLVDFLKKFDQNALVYAFEMSTGDWQEVPDLEEWLSQMIRTAADERSDLEKKPDIFPEGKHQEEINGMMKYVNKDTDVLITF